MVLYFSAILARVKAEQSINYFKAAVIKAILLRNSTKITKEVLNMGLNEQSDNKAYVLGRLFAVLRRHKRMQIRN